MFKLFSKTNMKKTYILDTNVLLSDPNCFNNFQDNDLIIPILVLEELDKQKGRSDEVGRSAREVNRILDNLISEGGSLKTGVQLPGGGILTVRSSSTGYSELLPPELVHGSSIDNMIIGFVLKLRSEYNQNVILVSKDINVRVKCSSLGIQAEDYLSLRISDSLDEIYTGVRVAIVNINLINDFYNGGVYYTKDLNIDISYPNQIFVLKSIDLDGNTTSSALARVMPDGRLKQLNKFDSIFGVRPRNKEQNFSFELLMDPAIKLVTLTGRAGSGKTLIALAAGLEQLESLGGQGSYQKLIVSRPVHPVGKDIGFLPGTLAEKMEPWLAPVRDNLEFLLGSGRKHINRRKKTDENSSGFKDPYLDLMQQKGLIEIEAISYIRGRSIPNTFMIIDEAQNLSIHELKTIITRAGENTKIILTGDIEQIDNVHVDAFTNGLTYAVEKFKEYDIAGHVSLIKGERSALATLAASVL